MRRNQEGNYRKNWKGSELGLNWEGNGRYSELTGKEQVMEWKITGNKHRNELWKKLGMKWERIEVNLKGLMKENSLGIK